MSQHRRIAWIGAVVLLVASLPALGVLPASATPATTTITVTSTTDAAGTCPSVSSCTLRQAFAEASTGGSAAATDVTIDITPSLGTITLASALSYDGGSGGAHALTIHGHGNTVSGGGGHRLIDSSSAGLLTVDDLTLTGGVAVSQYGGAINAAGAVSVTDSTFSSNTASAGGGAINATGAVTVSGSTFSGNSADTGGALYAASVDVMNSTFAANHATPGVAGAILAFGAVHAAYTTFAGNTSTSDASAIDSYSSNEIELFGSVLISPGSTADLCNVAATSDGYNFANDTSCGLTATGDSQSPTNDALLGALADNGGPTETQLPQSGSPLSGAIPDGACRTAPLATAVTTDQRGVDRPTAIDDACTIGAVEPVLLIVVTSNADTAGTCPSVASCTLRQAFTEASIGGTADGFDVAVQITSGLGTITLSSRLDHDGGTGGGHDLVIRGNGATIAGDDTFRLIQTTGTGHLTVDDLTMTDGNAGGVSGGAIEAAGSLTVANSTFRGNQALAGGAVSASGNITTTRSTFTGNTALGGGAIAADGTVTAINSTFSANQAMAGGAIAANALTLTYSTLNGNTANDGSVAYTNTTITLFGSVLISPGSTGTLCFGGPVSAGYNFANDTSCNLTATGDSQSPTNDALLGALADNGGPTHTQLPQTGSPLIDAIPDGSCQTSPLATGVSTDQRGFDRPNPVGGACDIGAVEVPPASGPPAPTGVAATTPGAGSHASTVSWTAPASGATPTGYQVRCLPDGTPFDTGPNRWVKFVEAAASPTTVDDLVGGIDYHCAVRARYGEPLEANEGPLSTWSNTFHTPLTAPGTPTRVSATTPPQPDGRSTRVTFTPAAELAGVPTTRFDASCTSSDGGATRTATTTSVGAWPTVTNLTQGRTYRCTVTATNAIGASSASRPSAAIVVPAGPPTGVMASSPVKAGGSWRTTVTFTRPVGGPTASNFRAACGSSNGGTARSATGSSTTIAVVGLSAGKTYRCTVTANFDGRNGPTSAPSSTITVPTR